MAASSSSRNKSRSSGPVLRSLSPCGRFYSPPSNPSLSASSSAFASSSSSRFYTSGSFFTVQDDSHHHSHSSHNHGNYELHRPNSPTRVNLYPSSSARSPTVRFSIDPRSISPNRSIAVTKQRPIAKKTCMCSPTTHPGSFRCSLHKNMSAGGGSHGGSGSMPSYPQNRLNMRRSAMTNSLVRIRGVEGELMRRALTALIRPSSHQQRRRTAYRPARSRLSVMSKAEDDV